MKSANKNNKPTNSIKKPIMGHLATMKAMPTTKQAVPLSFSLRAKNVSVLRAPRRMVMPASSRMLPMSIMARSKKKKTPNRKKKTPPEQKPAPISVGALAIYFFSNSQLLLPRLFSSLFVRTHISMVRRVTNSENRSSTCFRPRRW